MANKDKALADADAAAQSITADDLAVYMRQEFPAGEQHDAAVAAAAEGMSMVLTYLRRASLLGVPRYAWPAIRNVMLRRASAIFRAPTPERNSFNAGEVSVSYDPRILTGDERDLLRQYRRLRATTGEYGSGGEYAAQYTGVPCMPSTGLPLGVMALPAPCMPPTGLAHSAPRGTWGAPYMSWTGLPLGAVAHSAPRGTWGAP